MSSRPPADGWFLEVDIDEEDTRRLRPAGEPEWSPVVNDLPTIDIPVRPADGIWTSGRADEAEVRVYKDGVELPFEEITEINRRRGDGRSRVVLTCIGGTDLNKRVQRVYQNKGATTVVENLVTNETDLSPNVDQPGSGSGVQLLSVSKSADLDSELSPALEDTDIGDNTVPLSVNSSNDRIDRARTSWLFIATDGTLRECDTVSDPGAEDDTAVEMTSSIVGNSSRITFSNKPINYNIPEGNVGIAAHCRLTEGIDTTKDAFEVAVADQFTSGFGTPPAGEWGWVKAVSESQGLGLNNSESEARSVNIKVQGTNLSYGNERTVRVSAVVIYDTRAEPSGFDSNPDPYYHRPGPYDGTGPATRLETGEQLSQTTLEGSTTVVSLANGSAADTLETTARTPAGENTETGATTATVEPGATSDRASGAVALSGSGFQIQQSPETGVTPQNLDSLVLTGLSTGDRRIIGEAFDDDLVNILQDIGEQTGSVWAVEPGPNGPTLEWTRPGARDPQGTIKASAVDLDRISQRVEAATVRGGRRQRAEEFTAPDPSTTNTVTLGHDTIIPGTERVVRTSDDTEMEPITDYELDYLDGLFKPLAGGNIKSGDSLRIEYQQTPTGRYESGQFDGDAVADRVFDIGSVTTPDAANQAAKRIVRQTPAARIEARVDLSGLGPTTSVVRALGVDALDIDRPFSVQGFDDSPGSSVLRLGTARPVSEIVARIASDVGDVDQRV